MRLKDIFNFTIIALAAISCTHTLEYDNKGIEPQLLVNSQMISTDTVHLVYLSISKDDRVDTIRNGSVKCFINGTLAATAVADPNGNDNDYTLDDESLGQGDEYGASRSNQSRFIFKARFNEGDVVRIECMANDGEYSAWSEVTVPKAPQFEIIDTAKITVLSPDGYKEVNYRIRIKGTDFKGEKSYFRLKSRTVRNDTILIHDSYYDEYHTHYGRSGRGIMIDKGKDPILNDGAPSEDLDINGSSENTFMVFSDYLFRDSQFELSYQFDDWYIDQLPDDYLYWEDGNLNEAKMHIDVETNLLGITQTEYNYLKALSIYEYIYDDENIFMEPVSFPDNVEDGVGIVSIASPSVRRVAFHRTYENADE